MSLYVDASPLVPLLLPEPTGQVVDRWLRATSEALLVSDLTAVEVAAVISRAVRTGRVRAKVAPRLHADFAAWRDDATTSVENVPADLRVAALLVRQPNPKLLAADAIHLATCLRTGATLVTFDTDLLAIAAREGVPTKVPG